ncbi:MAG: hypothetical protein NT164_02675 [Verrucomicrobiae bacterium]|nr:hypothetical protein [Verrucomicrobiae bacterium]
MKTKNPSFLSQAARLLLITCATLTSCLFSLGTAAAQCTDIINNNLVSTGTTVKFGTTDQTIYYSIPTDAHFVIKGTKAITDSFTVDTLSFKTDSTLIVDGTLTVKNIISLDSNATMVLSPNAVVDLRGSTLTVSSLTLTDGTEIINGTYSFNDGDNTLSPVPADLLDMIPSYKLSNGAKLINGTLVIDSTQSDALHLVESNEHSSDQALGTVTLRKQN